MTLEEPVCRILAPRRRAAFPAALLAGLLFSFLFSCSALAPRAQAGTTGKLAGRVVDSKQQPLAYANVAVAQYRLGSVTDADGRYTILNLPPGKCTVRISMLSHTPVTVTDVEISPDKTSRVDAVLEDAAISMKEVVVSATRPVVDVSQTSTVANVSREEIQSLPVQELQDVVNLQAGVVDGHFRGGRDDEVQYQVDGVSVNNAYDNKSSLRIDRSLLQEVQVISGTFDAEYGQAMSGVVNAVLRSGTEKFRWDGEVLGGSFFYPGDRQRIVDYSFRPSAIQNFQLNVTGPLGTPKTVFLLNARRYHFDDYLYGTRRFVPTDRFDAEKKIFRPTGDNAQVPLSYTREWSGLAKVTNRSISNVELNYQAVLDVVDGRRANYAYRLNPDGLSRQHTVSVVHGLDWTQTFGTATVLKASLRQNYFDYTDMVYDDVNDARYDSAGPAQGDANYELGAVVQGVDFTRFEQRTDAALFKTSLTSQITQEHQIKTGFEIQYPHMSFGTPGYLTYTTGAQGTVLTRPAIGTADHPGVQEYRPILAAAFAQEQTEWNDLTLRAGVRLDYFNARSTVPADPANPANSIQGAPASSPRATSKKIAFSPRLGVSYPLSRKASLYFAYGHFYQLPGLKDIFSNANYSVLSNLQAGDEGQSRFGVLGNPDIKPERTVQYQLGLKDALTENLGLDLTLFYKDIRDLLGVEFVSTYTTAEYARLTNVDFGNVIGFTVALDQRHIGPLSSTLDYTWQMAQGNSSDPRETATRAAAGEDPRPRQVPLNWDQRHTLNMTLTLAQPHEYNVSSVIHVGSGQPYTPVTAVGYGAGLETNSGRKPAGMVIDLRAEKALRMGGRDLKAFARVFNLLDTRYYNGFVFATTGSPYYSRSPVSDQTVLADPTRFYAPRRIEVGLSVETP